MTAMRYRTASRAALLVALALPASASLAVEEPEIARQSWSFVPPFGAYDNAQLQRGFKVYKEVCSNCHSMRLLSYRNLGEPGGPEFSPKAVEVLASQVQVSDGPNEQGEILKRLSAMELALLGRTGRQRYEAVLAYLEGEIARISPMM